MIVVSSEPRSMQVFAPDLDVIFDDDFADLWEFYIALAIL